MTMLPDRHMATVDMHRLCDSELIWLIPLCVCGHGNQKFAAQGTLHHVSEQLLIQGMQHISFRPQLVIHQDLTFQLCRLRASYIPSDLNWDSDVMRDWHSWSERSHSIGSLQILNDLRSLKHGNIGVWILQCHHIVISGCIKQNKSIRSTCVTHGLTSYTAELLVWPSKYLADHACTYSFQDLHKQRSHSAYIDICDSSSYLNVWDLKHIPLVYELLALWAVAGHWVIDVRNL